MQRRLQQKQHPRRQPIAPHSRPKVYYGPEISTHPSPRPLIVGLLFVVLVVGIFLLKTYKNKDELASLAAQGQNDQNYVKKTIPTPTISPEEASKMIRNQDYQIIDIRDATSYTISHLESSINIPTAYAGELIDEINKQKKIIVVDYFDTPEGKAFADVLIDKGFNVSYLEGGLQAYNTQGLPLVSFGSPTSYLDKSKTRAISAVELADRVGSGESFAFLDVRDADEDKQTSIEGSINIPLDDLEDKKEEIPGGKIIIYDENPTRSYQAAVKLYDMNIIGAYYLSDSLSHFKGVIEARKNPPSQQQ